MEHGTVGGEEKETVPRAVCARLVACAEGIEPRRAATLPRSSCETVWTGDGDRVGDRN